MLSATTQLLYLEVDFEVDVDAAREHCRASPTVFVIVTELPAMVVFLIVAADTLLVRCIPPEFPPKYRRCLEVTRQAQRCCRATKLLIRVNVRPNMRMAPPSAKRPLAPVALAWLS